MPELMVIFVIALVVFGPRRLPEIGRSLGRTIAEFKRASSELRDTFEREVELDAERARKAAGTPSAEDAAAAAKRSEFSEQLSRSASGDLS
jgi:sec-independent protein translocase protein TatA